MINSISQGAETLTITASTTLGYGPAQIAPPRFLLCNASGPINVVLPTIPSVMPVPPGTPGTTPGVGDGLLLTIRNLTANAVTVAAASGDTLVDPLQLTGQGACENIAAVYGNRSWYRSVNPGGASGVRTVGAATTVTTADRYIITSTATTVTLLAATAVPVGVELLTIINSSSGSDTVTPAQGTVNGAASLTMTTKTSAGFISDGQNYFITHL
jgi:hypothetical protein